MVAGINSGDCRATCGWTAAHLSLAPSAIQHAPEQLLLPHFSCMFQKAMLPDLRIDGEKYGVQYSYYLDQAMGTPQTWHHPEATRSFQAFPVALPPSSI